jgi:hypothetical protein
VKYTAASYTRFSAAPQTSPTLKLGRKSNELGMNHNFSKQLVSLVVIKLLLSLLNILITGF